MVGYNETVEGILKIKTMSILLTFSYIYYFQLRVYSMCGSELVYKKYLACHKFIHVSKGHLLNQNKQSKVHSYCIILSFWFTETHSDIGITSFNLMIEIHTFLTYIIIKDFELFLFFLNVLKQELMHSES